MNVLGISLENYRNLAGCCIEPCEKVNVIYGKNAQGKTNLLEALWMFCGGHSFRGSKDAELIAFGKDHARLCARFNSYGREQNAEIKIFGGKREVCINDVPKKSASALIEKYSAVVFSPEHLNLVKRGPSKRRNFIDSAVCREKIKNAVIFSRYNKTLNQRNALLKDIYRHKELKETLDIWDDSLCVLGASLIRQRMEYIELLSSYASAYHDGISGGKETLEFSYLSSVNVEKEDDENTLRLKLKQAFSDSRKEDISSGYTNCGPHRDDINIVINGKKAKNFASQGQQRSAVLSMKLAEAAILKERTGENPIILLDDVLSELDSQRQDFLLNKVEDYQVFMTCCEKSDKEQLKNGKIFKIEDGRIS